MTEENSKSADVLARLRGIATGGANLSETPKPAAQPQTGEENKPKRDIQELYDFIDKYCADKEAQANQQNP